MNTYKHKATKQIVFAQRSAGHEVHGSLVVPKGYWKLFSEQSAPLDIAPSHASFTKDYEFISGDDENADPIDKPVQKANGKKSGKASQVSQ